MTVALIVAAGSGERLGAGRPKALVELAGRPLYTWSLNALRETRGVQRIAVALPSEHAYAALVAAPASEHAHAAPAAAPASEHEDANPLTASLAATPPQVVAAAGGATRSESVRKALEAVGPGDPVLVHDAARPLLTPAIAEAVIAALLDDADADGAIAAMPVTDTVKRVDSAGAVRETLDRSELWAVQTPQVFRRAALERALDVPDEQLARATDDAWLVERAGGRVIVVPASEENLKVTTPLDLQLAARLLAARREPQGGAASANPA